MHEASPPPERALERPELYMQDSEVDAHREPTLANTIDDPVAEVLLTAHDALRYPEREPYAVALLHARYRFRLHEDLGVFYLDRRLASTRSLADAVLSVLRNPQGAVPIVDLLSDDTSAGDASDAVDVLATDLGLTDALDFEVTYLKQGYVPLRIPDLDKYANEIGSRVVPGRYQDPSSPVQSLVYRPTDGAINPSTHPSMQRLDARWPLTVLEDVRIRTTTG